MMQSEENALKPRYGGGPHGLGDPADKRLRKVEMDVLIPKIMRDRARIEKCVDVVKAFEACCKESSLLMVVKCRRENEDLKTCLTKWYQDDKFRDECKDIYLKDRTEYRTTGIPKKQRNQPSNH